MVDNKLCKIIQFRNYSYWLKSLETSSLNKSINHISHSIKVPQVYKNGKMYLIRRTSCLYAGSRIIENNLLGIFSLFLSYAGGVHQIQCIFTIYSPIFSSYSSFALKRILNKTRSIISNQRNNNNLTLF